MWRKCKESLYWNKNLTLRSALIAVIDFIDDLNVNSHWFRNSCASYIPSSTSSSLLQSLTFREIKNPFIVPYGR